MPLLGMDAGEWICVWECVGWISDGFSLPANKIASPLNNYIFLLPLIGI